MSETADIVFAGGGLASCIVGLRLSESHPDYAITIIEAGKEICGNHTWSFHHTDLPKHALERLMPLIAYRWAGQKVKFPDFERSFDTAYYSLTSSSLRQAVYDNPRITVLEDSTIEDLDGDKVVLSNGARIRAPCVIDGRGFAETEALSLGFQKFIGLEVELSSPHGEEVPTIMDASVDQHDGYRFIYVLPFSSSRLLIEDTRYSDSGHLDVAQVEQDVRDYAQGRGWDIKRITRREKGVLPIALAYNANLFWQQFETGAAPIGLRAGLFHPTTGYSLPECVRVADLLAGESSPLRTERVRQLVRKHAFRRNRQQAFFRMLNRFLFCAAMPDRRYLIMQRFYTLPQDLIERFYAGRTTLIDKCRLVTGSPPVPIPHALPFVREPSLQPARRTHDG